MMQTQSITSFKFLNRYLVNVAVEGFSKPKAIRFLSSQTNGEKTNENLSHEQYVQDQVK